MNLMTGKWGEVHEEKNKCTQPLSMIPVVWNRMVPECNLKEWEY